MVDQFTKWPEAIATKNQDAELTANIFMEKIVARFGVPHKIITDQGRQFESTIFKKLCHGLSIEKARTSAYHPQSNGVAERCVKTLKERLKFLCQDDTFKWDQKLDHALMAIRFSKHCSTGFSPTIPDTKFCSEKIDSWRSESKFINNLKGTLKKIDDRAFQNIQTQQANYSKQYNKHVHEYNINIQDLVARKSIAQGALIKAYVKPAIVTEKISKTNYRVEGLDPPHKSDIIHHNRLKKLKTRCLDAETPKGGDL
ncbi:Gag-Pol polyprotein [Thelohanellus kitauei]|uniref:Gag-Pol polyprotein n=1 Tax=Thelohanellus kitauei TaxID=669202 RepID=A0A0C2J801_THEKT|nr:Gag-Pol polyprotein [Thelohanellus kitauei]